MKNITRTQAKEKNLEIWKEKDGYLYAKEIFKLVPSKDEIIAEMEAYNSDEISEKGGPIDFDDAEYNLLLSDEYHTV